jgi:hypothetical protein
MKTFLIIPLLVLFVLTPNIKANTSVSLDTVTNLIEQANQAVNQANKTLALIQSFQLSNSPSTANFNNNSYTTNGVVRSSTKEEINEAVVDILHGVKGAGSEIYSASKSAIVQSVDFTKEQAPLVVKEFLTWKLWEAIIYFIAFSVPSVILLFLAYNFSQKVKSDDVPVHSSSCNDKSDYSVLKWVTRIAAIILLNFNLTFEGLVIVKILVAPRVYIIEYVVDTIHNGQVPSR